MQTQLIKVVNAVSSNYALHEPVNSDTVNFDAVIDISNGNLTIIMISIFQMQRDENTCIFVAKKK